MSVRLRLLLALAALPTGAAATLVVILLAKSILG